MRFRNAMEFIRIYTLHNDAHKEANDNKPKKTIEMLKQMLMFLLLIRTFPSNNVYICTVCVLCDGEFCGNNSLSVCVISVCAHCDILYIDLSITWKKLDACSAFLQTPSRRTNKQSQIFLGIPTKTNESGSFDFARQTPLNGCRFVCHLCSSVQNIKLRFVQQIKYGFVSFFIQFEVKS